MKKYMSWLSGILAAVMILGSCPVWAEDTVSTETEQQAVEAYVEAAQTLAGIGILTQEEADSMTGGVITRGDAALLLCRLVGIEDYTVGTGGIRFLDVTDPELAGAVRMLCDMKIISDPADGMYRPQDALSYNEAVKLVVCLLGYGAKADASGGYPIGHLTMASTLKLSGNVSAEADGTISQGAFYQLLFNALDVEVMEGVTNGIGGYIYTEGDTLLSMHMDLTMTRGVVTANKYTKLSGGEGVNDGEIALDGRTLKMESVDYSDLLGYTVKCYTRIEDDEEIVVYMMPYRTEVTEINTDDISLLTTNQIRYIDETGRQRTDSLQTDCAVIYNGSTAVSLTDADLQLHNGTVKLVDNDSDGGYDVLIIDDYVTYRVKGVNQTTQEIYLKGFDIAREETAVTIPFNFQNRNPIVEVISGGSVSGVDRLQDNGTVSVSRSLDGRVTRLHMVTTMLDNVTVAGIEDDGDTIVIDDTAYQVARDANGDLAVRVQVGQRTTFYLDRDGKIAGIGSSTAQNGIYGYLVEMDAASLGNVQLKILPETGTLTVYDGASSITVNGQSVSGTSVPTHPALSENGATKPQLILFKVNSAGQVREIITASEDETATLRLSEEYDEVMYDRDFIGQDFMVTSDVQVFVVPEDLTKDEGYEAGGKSLLTNRMECQMEVYDADAAQRVPRVVVHRNASTSSGSISQSASFAVIKNIIPSVYEDETRYKIEFIVNGNEEFGYTNEDMTVDRSNVRWSLPSNLGYVTCQEGKLYLSSQSGAVSADAIEMVPGDVVEYNKDGNNQIGRIKPIYIAAAGSTGELHRYGGSAVARVIRASYVTLNRIVDGIAFFDGGGDIEGKPIPLSSATVYRVQREPKVEVTECSVAEMMPGQNMLIRLNYEKALEILIFE